MPAEFSLKHNGKFWIKGFNFPIEGSGVLANVIIKDNKYPIRLYDAENFKYFRAPLDIGTGKMPFDIEIENYGIIGSVLITMQYDLTWVGGEDFISDQGEDLELNGSGFSEYSKVIINEKPCNVRNVTAHQIYCTAPPNPEGQYNIYVETPSHEPTYKTNGVHYKSSLTPKVLTSLPTNKNSIISLDSNTEFTYTVKTIDNFTTDQVSIHLQSQHNPSVRLDPISITKSGASEYAAVFDNLIQGTFDVLVYVKP